MARVEQPTAVVFDMDGTLLDSERLARRCFVEACTDVGWHDVDLSVYNRCVGSTGDTTERILRSSFGPSFDFAAVRARWSARYDEALDAAPVPLLDGVAELLQQLRDMGVPMAVATSSRRPVVEKKLSGSDIAKYFEFLICGGETDQGKPHPHPYLSAVTQLEVSAGHCWAVEDSDNGVRSATAAGLKVFQIPDEIAPSEEVLALGHEVLPSARALLLRLQSDSG